MSTLEKYLAGWRDEYYRVVLTCREARGHWTARATVRRIDTDEAVGGEQRYGESKGHALSLAVENLDSYLDSLPRPPVEWGRVALRQLLVDYKEFNYKLTSSVMKLEKLRCAGTLSAVDLHEFHWGNRDFVIKNSIIFARKLQNLSEQDRIDLMTSPESVYMDPIDPWNLGDRDARSEIFEFIVNPSPEVIGAHEIHDTRKTS